jgi:glycosyltransferase involved in cell wall biosynthesis
MANSKTTPAVSVCIPTYEYGRFVGRAIDSVLAQTRPDFELLVIDDVSTDDTAAVVEPYTADPRVRFERNERNLGLFGNFNRCLERASASYVRLLLADDWLHPRALEDALGVFEGSPELGLVTSPAYHVDVAGSVRGGVRGPFGRAPVVPRARAREALADWGNIVGMPTQVTLPREVVEDVGGYDPRFAPASDVHLWLRVLANHDMGWIPAPRAFIRLHAEHSHDYGTDPTEAGFALWEDLAARPGSGVDERLLERARYGEARSALLWVGSHMLALRARPALAIVQLVGRHVRWPRVLARFVRELPGLLRGQLARVFAQRTGRMVVYEPQPRAGPRRTTSARGPDH